MLQNSLFFLTVLIASFPSLIFAQEKGAWAALFAIHVRTEKTKHLIEVKPVVKINRLISGARCIIIVV